MWFAPHVPEDVLPPRRSTSTTDAFLDTKCEKVADAFVVVSKAIRRQRSGRDAGAGTHLPADVVKPTAAAKTATVDDEDEVLHHEGGGRPR